jgi:hypothetical protein
MAHMRKMALVPVATFNNGLLPAPKPKPYARAVASLDDQMNDILYDSDLDTSTRADLLQQAMRRYLLFQSARPNDYPKQVSSTQVSTLASTPPSTSLKIKSSPPKSSTPSSQSKATTPTNSDDDDDDEDDKLLVTPSSSLRPVLVRSQAATSGKVVAGRPSAQQQSRRRLVTTSVKKRTLRAWQPYKN